MSELEELRTAIKAINCLVAETDFGLDLEMWGMAPDGNGMLPVEERKPNLQLLAQAQTIVGEIYQIVHSETSDCGTHDDWKKVKYNVLAAFGENTASSR